MLTRRPAVGAVRPAVSADLPGLVQLCSAHAEFERAAAVPEDLAARLESALFAPQPRAWCFVAEQAGELIGYASCSLEFATWRAAEYLHLDCLFITESHRGGGWGRRLLDAVAEAGVARGVTELQWQTPDWNADAIAFYERIGARGAAKVRFSLPLGG
jgi:GNAT superfamily N-acetyltransferase